MTCELTISKTEVYAEVDRAAAYSAAKTPSKDPAADFERVSLTSSDAQLFDRFWREAVSVCSDTFRRIISSISLDSDALALDIDVSASFDAGLTPLARADLHSFFVKGLLARWYAVTMPSAAADAAAEAAAYLEAAHRKLISKKKPSRPSLSVQRSMIND